MSVAVALDFPDSPYDPQTGRFLSADPIGFQAGDTNLYRYVFNNPVKYTDPTGTIVPVILLTYAAYEAGFFIGATYNKIAQDTDYSTTYRDANPILNLAEQVLPTTSLFSSPDTYKVINDKVNNNRINQIDSMINDNSNNNGGVCGKK